MMVQLVRYLSDELVAGLAAAGWPPLRPLLDGKPGRIILGDPHKFDQFMPPRVIFTPSGSAFSGRASSRGPVPVANNASKPDAESALAIAARAILTDRMAFDVRAWGVASDKDVDPDGMDYEYTQAIVHQLLASCQKLASGVYNAGTAKWEPVEHQGRVGRQLVFTLTVDAPVLAQLIPADAVRGVPGAAPGLPYAPAGTAGAFSDAMVIPSGQQGPGCE